MKKYKLKNNWNLWYHSINDNNWKLKSYKKLLIIQNLFDYKLIQDNFKKNYYTNGMYFLMKENIDPIWESPENRLGGYISFKIKSDDVINKWNNLMKHCICNELFNNNNDIINGISISPKKEFNIIKIWLNTDIDNYNELLNKNINDKHILYRKYIID